MVFTSWAFAIFFTVVLILLAAARNRSQRQWVILLANIFFYGFWKWQYLALLATPSIIDYICATRIAESESQKIRKRWLTVSIVTNLGLLGYFKYTNFFIDNFDALFGHRVSHLNILLPVGISFYTFKTLSYTVDVYRRELEPCRSIWKYAMFVSYFPELVAGPIVRASVFLPQMSRSLKPSWARTMVGMQLIMMGVTKKIVIADRLSGLSDTIFSNPGNFSPLTVASGVLAYAIQIYCDFSGYSDMAIGISRIIGFDLPENFNMPYSSLSVTEFWRRWHITLSTWLRDYLYIPLGGNRRGRRRTYINLFATMLLGGLWHGASWNFVIWGGLHGCALAVHKWWTSSRYHFPLPKAVSWALTFSYVCISWIFFRSATLSTSMLILKKVVGVAQGGLAYTSLPLLLIIPAVIGAHYLGGVTEQLASARKGARRLGAPAWLKWAYVRSQLPYALRPHKQAGIYVLAPVPTFVGSFVLTLWVIGIVLFAQVNAQPFIYFQF